MENIVDCIICKTKFNFSPGNAGNARQLCDKCRVIEDEKELEALKEETIIEGNKYLVGAPKRKNVYDPSDILLNGNIPTFNSEADMFIFAMEVGNFCRKNQGFMGCDENVAKLLHAISLPNRVIFLKQQNLQTFEYMARNIIFKPFVQLIMKVGT